MAIKVPSSGQYPPFEVIDSQHHAGIIIITAAICLVITLVCLLIRVYVRVLLSPTFGIDDWILLAATVRAPRDTMCRHDHNPRRITYRIVLWYRAVSGRI
jgi:hypothetical protein